MEEDLTIADLCRADDEAKRDFERDQKSRLRLRDAPELVFKTYQPRPAANLDIDTYSREVIDPLAREIGATLGTMEKELKSEIKALRSEFDILRRELKAKSGYKRFHDANIDWFSFDEDDEEKAFDKSGTNVA